MQYTGPAGAPISRLMLGQRPAGESLVNVEDRVLRRAQPRPRAEVIEAVSRWIDTVYNTRRRHSALGQISPLQFETQYKTAAQGA